MSNTEHPPEVDLLDPSSFPVPQRVPPTESSRVRGLPSEAQDADKEDFSEILNP